MNSSDTALSPPQLLPWALWYAQSGLPVFPLAPGTKVPIGGKGAHDATTDQDQIRGWWAQEPRANVGVALPGCAVVDADPRHYEAGVDSLARLEAQCTLPVTLRVSTPSGGAHLYYRTEPGEQFAGKVRGFPGLDFKRGAGSYVVGAGSYHPDFPHGPQYAISLSAPIAPLPDSLRVYVRKDEPRTAPALAPSQTTTSYGRTALEGECTAVRAAPNGEQESTLNAAALKVGSLVAGGQIEVSEARAALVAAGLAMFSHGAPWTEADVIAKVARGLDHGARTPRGPRAEPVATDWRMLSVADIFAPLAPIRHLVPALDLAPGAPAIAGGYGFSGKTVAAQSMAVSIATGRSIWGGFAARPGRVLHVDFEQGPHLTRQRYQRLALGLGVEPAELADRLVLVSMPGTYLDGRDVESVLCGRCEGFDLVIVDSLLASAPSIDENDSSARRVLDVLNRVSDRSGASFLVIHHARKPSKDSAGGAKMALRGSSALFDACSSVLMFEAEQGEPPRVTHTKARNTGRPAPPFVLRIEDTEPRAFKGADVAAQAGLVVRMSDAAAQVEAARQRGLDEARGAVLGAFISRESFANQEAIRAQTGLGAQKFRAAYSVLLDEGAIVELGPARGPGRTIMRAPASSVPGFV